MQSTSTQKENTVTHYIVADQMGVRVMREQCATCIFRPGNLMYLNPGRRKQMVTDAHAEGGQIPCHETFDDELQAICKGYYELKPLPDLLQVAERLGAIVEWDR